MGEWVGWVAYVCPGDGSETQSFQHGCETRSADALEPRFIPKFASTNKTFLSSTFPKEHKLCNMRRECIHSKCAQSILQYVQLRMAFNFFWILWELLPHRIIRATFPAWAM